MKVKELMEALKNCPEHFYVDCLSEHLLWDIECVVVDELDDTVTLAIKEMDI